MKKTILLISLLIALVALISCGKQEPVAPESTQSEKGVTLPKQGGGEEGDPYVLDLMHQINDQLAASGSNLFLNEIQFFTIGGGRPTNRILGQPFRWVPNDQRRLAQGIDITYIVDQTFQGTSSSVSAAATEAEIDASMNTWDTQQALQKVSIEKRADLNNPDVDISIFDEFFQTNLPFGDTNPDQPDLGFPFAADIVNVGWYPRGYFEAVGGPGGGDGILAFSVTFFFVDPATGILTDINGDNRFDSALNEVYYNDTFGKAGEPREGNPWTTGQQALPNIDVQTVAFHENGHSLGIGHFGPPPVAALNPIYAGPRIAPFPTDLAAMDAVWASWPNP